MISSLSKLRNQGLIDDLDYHFADFIGRIETTEFSSAEFEILLKSAALISRQINNGHICLAEKDVENIQKEIPDGNEIIPDWKHISEVMKKSVSCSFSEKMAPVIFDGKRFYLYRYWKYENNLAGKIIQLSLEKGKYSGNIDKIYEMMKQIFGDDGRVNGQLDAGLLSLKNRFSVITGGPGTGKTTTIAKIISVLWTLFPDEKIVLAAPTGKAASRMSEALKNAVFFMGDSVTKEIKDRILSLGGTSIHRLLGWTSRPGVFKHNSENPLNADFLIVDEASMVDLSLMSQLIDSIRENTSILLLGDKDQLTSVEAGNVLGDICDAAQRKYIKAETVTELKKSYRFGKNSLIGELASNINESESISQIKRTFDKCEDNSISYINSRISSSIKMIEKTIIEKYSCLFQNESPENILESLEKFRILCALRNDRGGVSEINKLAETIFYKQGLIPSLNETWYNGRPVMVTKNNYNLELFNGECGVVLQKNGEKRAYFTGNGNNLRSIPVSALSDAETVYAMTIHKSQGSEYESVMVILPEKDMPILTKELIYTAVTRAKKGVTLISEENILAEAVKKTAVRNSGLADTLKFLSKQ